MKKARLAVGVTGHLLNQLPANVFPVVGAAITYALTLVEAARRDSAETPAQMTLVSAIAEGADRLAAIAALKLKWRLETPLPFAPERYAATFPDDASQAEFKALLKRSKRIAVTPMTDQPGPAPYAGVGAMVVEWSDVLVVVWNGRPPKGPGGTAEVAALMTAKGGAVIWIPSEAGGPLQLIAPDVASPFVQQLARRLPRIAQPDAMRVA